MKKCYVFVIGLLALLSTSCGQSQTEVTKKASPPTLITTTQSVLAPIEVVEKSVGMIETDAAPVIAAEVAGQITKVWAAPGDPVEVGTPLAQIDAQDFANIEQAGAAEINTLSAQLEQQRKQVERYRELYRQHFISPTKLEELETQLTVLQQQLQAARSRHGNTAHSLAKTKVLSPIKGRVDERMVSSGDFVSVGKALFRLASAQKLRVHLPFPEILAERIKPGMDVKLISPVAPDQVVAAKIYEVRPLITGQSKSFEALVVLDNPGHWKPGASVDAQIILETHPQAVLVPETSVVLRPAGKVVYVVEGTRVRQHSVTTGVSAEGKVEILSGLANGQAIAVDGAGFLTDQALIKVILPKPAGKPS